MRFTWPRWLRPHRLDVRRTQPWVVVALIAFAVLITVGGIGIVTNSEPDGPTPTVVPGPPGTVTVVVTPVPAPPGPSGAPGSPGTAGSPGAPGRPGGTSSAPGRPSPTRTPSRPPSPTATRSPTPTSSPGCTLHDPRDGHCIL